MKILRSVTRRGFNVGTAGFFSGLLRPNTWFPATRLPGSLHHPGVGSKGSAHPEQRTLISASGRDTTLRFAALKRTAQDHPLLRPALIVLGAIAITSALLLWIMHP
jgi:hypothetical protein